MRVGWFVGVIRVGAWVVLGVALLGGCQDDRERLSQVCHALEARVSSAHDCAALASDLEALVEEERELLERVQHMPAPSDAQAQRAWRTATEPCYRANLDVALGVCANDTRVRELMAVFGR